LTGARFSLAIALCVLWSALALAQARPNIVLIVVDDIGYSDLGAFGGEIETPNIDSLASGGVRFSNFHTASSCAPTRAMLLTGLDNHLAGIGSMRELVPLSHRGQPGYEGVLRDDVRTVSSMLQSAGYRTVVAGKWHLGDDAGNLPPARGFDYSVIQADSGSDNFEIRPYLPMRPEVYWYENGERLTALPDGFYSSTFFVDAVIDFLGAAESRDTPFFAYVAFQANHTPIQAPASFIDRYRGRYEEGWAEIRNRRVKKIRDYGLIDPGATIAAGPSQQAWESLTGDERYFEARRMQAYAGMATAMDHEVGRLVAWLRETGRYDDTVFVVLSDNGATTSEPYENRFGRRWLEANYHRDVETLGEKGSWVAAGRNWGAVSNTPFNGYKFYAGEGGVRVPLIVAGLPGIAPGTVDKGFVYVTDLAPTLLEIAGLAPPEAMRGRSILPLFREGSGSLHDADEAIGYEFSGNAALYRGRYKIARDRPPVGDRQWRLYDLVADPGETTDLSGSMPERFQDMLQAYSRYEEDAGVLPLPEDYSLVRQVTINALLFFYLPRYLPQIIAGIVLLVVLLCVLVYRRRAG
jgi:arylsulfatase A-like enzyme